MKMQVEQTGGRDLVQRLEGINKRMRSKISRSAVNAGGTIILRSVRQRIKRRTGTTAKAQGKKGFTRGDEYKVKIGARPGYAVTINGRVHDPVHTNHLIEGGAKPHEITTRRGVTYLHPGAPAQPFLAPSLNENAGEIRDVMSRKINEGLAREAAR